MWSLRLENEKEFEKIIVEGLLCPCQLRNSWAEPLYIFLIAFGDQLWEQGNRRDSTHVTPVRVSDVVIE